MWFYNNYLEEKNLKLINIRHYKDELNYLKDVIFIKCLVFVFSLSLFVLIPGIIYGITSHNLNVVLWDVVTYLVVFSLIYLTKIKLTIRKLIFVFSIYLLGFQLLFELGMDGAGVLFWVIGNITSSLLFNRIQLGLILLINTVVLFYFGYLIYNDFTSVTFSKSLSVFDWLIISLNMLFLSLIVASFLNRLLSIMNKVLLKEKKTQQSIQKTSDEIIFSNILLNKKNNELEQIAFLTAKNLANPLKDITIDLANVTQNITPFLDEKGERYLHFANEGANRMNVLIDGLAQLAFIDQHVIELKRININETIRSIVHGFDSAVTTQLTFSLDTDELVADQQLFIQLITIVLSNSFTYRENDQVLKLQISFQAADDDFWKLSIADNGIGIEDVYFERIFQIYQRLHKQNEYPGQGIGLALAKRIVTKINGQIQVCSTKNVGTRFTIIIPKINTI